ncbi:MAG: phosphodiester glycosidase family protein [Myxococcales bacterium]|nr:phosphodiester glycosidase family protein [Myxococcales bacterium]
MNRRYHGLVLALALSASSLPSVARADDRWSSVRPGLRLLRRSTRHADGAPLVLHVAVLNLCAVRGRFRATSPSETPSTTSRFAQRTSALVAINGDFFDRPGVPLGRARGDGREFAPRPEYYFGALVVARSGALPMVLERYEAPRQYTEVVSAQERVVVAGAARVDPHVQHSRQRHPRTAMGWSRDGRTVIFVVVDGRSRASAGATTPELALILRDLGAWEAVRFDGGGSSTLVVRSRVVNSPSDGAERSVANHLAFVEDPSSPSLDACLERAPDVVDIAPDAPRDSMPFPARTRAPRIAPVLARELSPLRRASLLSSRRS